MKRQTECICVNLRRAARALTALYDEALAASGVKITQFSLLRAIERNEPAAIGMLSDDLDLDRTTLARNLAPLQRDRLIELRTGSDRRVSEVRLTRKGRSAIGKALPLWQKAQTDIGRRFAAGRLDQLRAVAAEAVQIAAGMEQTGELKSSADASAAVASAVAGRRESRGSRSVTPRIRTPRRRNVRASPASP